jgi:uncharacterized protein (TIGR00725 family)
MSTIVRRPIVGVLGSGSHEHAPAAAAVGHLLARLGVHLLTGGGAGVMSAVSRAYSEVADRGGLVIGILPCRQNDVTHPKEGYPNPWIEIAIPTHLPLSGKRGTEAMSRNHINVLASNALIVLPGGHGTESEAELAIRYKKPVVAFLENSDQMPGLSGSVALARTIGEVEDFLRSAIHLLPPVTPNAF